jgi:hypothetical protein
MQIFWRAAGLSYVRYVNICSKALRSVAKPAARTAGKYEVRDSTLMTYRKWANGKKGAAGAFVVSKN